MRSCQQPNYRVSATLPLRQLPRRARHSRKRAADAEIQAADSWQDIGASVNLQGAKRHLQPPYII
ncbi:hypothetical protein GGR51DRAFT_567785 [Nemania sp. FL0031]|nr:hypothetical protein GGR51DRAFT_567785 [Nemania sp. FL0031]